MIYNDIERKIRVEVSGILSESKNNTVKHRANIKREQSENSDSSNTDVIISIVEFGKPQTKIDFTMSVRELHKIAMDFAEEAEIKYNQGKVVEALELYSKALDNEMEAAYQIEPFVENEPTRSILYISAANLAYHAEEYDTAERLCNNALAGFPEEEHRIKIISLLSKISNLRSNTDNGHTQMKRISVYSTSPLDVVYNQRVSENRHSVLLNGILDSHRSCRTHRKQRAVTASGSHEEE